MFRDLQNTSKTRPTPTPKLRLTPTNDPSQTILGANTRIVGSLKSEGHVHLEDTFEGNIAAGGRVSLGGEATLDGNLICERAIVAGLVKGDVTARTISVLGTGRVLGNLRMEKLLTEEGAFIQGTITLEESLLAARPAETKQATPVSVAEASPAALERRA